MKLLPIESILIPPNRQRREFDPSTIVELANSIQSIGLLNPITIREEGNEVFLIAGERRFKAMCHLNDLGVRVQFNNSPVPEWQIPTVTLGELSPLSAMEAEYEENVRRADLLWPERADAEARLHTLRTAQSPTHSIADTAQEIHGRSDGHFHESVRRSTILARHLSDPDVARARTADDAMKILKRKESAAKNVELATSVGLTFSSALHSLHNTDAIEWMRSCPAGTFDVILTDPPYGMDAQNFGDGAGCLDSFTHAYDDSEEHFTTLLSSFFRESFRVTKPQAHLYVCCDLDRFHWLRFQAQKSSWWVHRTPLINVKDAGGRIPWPEHGPRRCWEMLLYAVKGKKPTNMIAPDVITTRLTEETYNHGAQKPISLYTDLLKRSTRPGDRVLDPFCGTGTIFPAAHELKCLATGVELSREYYGIALKRLGDLT